MDKILDNIYYCKNKDGKKYKTGSCQITCPKTPYYDNIIKYVDIPMYNTKRNIITCSLSDYIKLLTEQASPDNKNVEIHDNLNNSLLEILTDNTVRMYFDIENIPRDNPDMIYEIIKEMLNMLKIDYDKFEYALTHNANSHHEGLSYHLFFPFKTTKLEIRKFIMLFNYQTNNKYIEYIDYRVYGSNRLFRTVGSRCPGKSKPYSPRNPIDYHVLVKGKLEDTIIQNYGRLTKYFTCSCCDNTWNTYEENFYKLIDKMSDNDNSTPEKRSLYDLYVKPITISRECWEMMMERKFNRENMDKNKDNKELNNSSEVKDVDIQPENEKVNNQPEINNQPVNKQENKLMDQFKDSDQIKKLIENQNQLNNNNNLTMIMFIAVIVLLIANLFK